MVLEDDKGLTPNSGKATIKGMGPVGLRRGIVLYVRRSFAIRFRRLTEDDVEDSTRQVTVVGEDAALSRHGLPLKVFQLESWLGFLNRLAQVSLLRLGTFESERLCIYKTRPRRIGS